MTQRRRVAIVTATRAEYGYTKRLMELMRNDPLLELQLIVSGTHLLKEFGYTVNLIEQDGFPIAAKVSMIVSGDTAVSHAQSVAVGMTGFIQAFDMLQPDLVLVSGDRGEMLAATVSAAYMNLPVGHIQAGEISGNIDGITRHAISRFAHLLFTANTDAASRLERMGEEKKRIFVTGAPMLDGVIHEPKLGQTELSATIGLDFSKPTAVVLFHGETLSANGSYQHMISLLQALQQLSLQALIINPNVDPGSVEIQRAIQDCEGRLVSCVAPNLERRVFLSALTHAAVLVGNSSCGIIEAPALQLPTVNIGNRERGRLRTRNVIDVEHGVESIAKGVQQALDPKFKASLTDCVSPYGDGRSSERILKIIKEISLSQELLDKRLAY
ncbi:MAG: UDP-N-acetylglucosamine 2-epimerase (hydrolyzing) [Candidatus Omnitrophica bacterium]|nr:UDP-N-acetylglucosamine 2-epimerase (hydrolyzing) [Candidatus Omnitrophota bacterium]MBI2174545.1 UDP-N-acetylglucosamine 2-epimerase (hydrolyzing) [Candidatus Omnitrophota bacterium]MBI3010230.1 UDP-N-acetylglucosamine 2-epimerase (hydrolyzing) [Candidatus Omnitrophota bacterium]